MAFQQIDTSSGQVSGVDDLGPAASSVINWEADESGVSRPRAGLTTHTTTGGGSTASMGLCRFKEYIVSVTEDRYMRVLADATPTAFSAVSTSATTTQVTGIAPRVTFALGDSYVYAAGGGQVQRWTNSGLGNAEVLSASPLGTTHIATLGQRLVANDTVNPSSFYWSDIGEGAWATWPSENVSNADARPDPIVGIYENTNELFIFGSETLQVFAVGSDPTFPFESVTSVNVGLGAPYGVCRVDSTFAFLDDHRRIVISDGRTVEPISDAIQKTIRGLATTSDCWMYREERGQHSSLVVRLPTERRTFAYDLKGEKWSERNYYSAPFQGDFPVSAHVYWPAYNYNILGSTSSGLLRMDEDSRQDIAGPLVCERTTGWHDFGTVNRKRSGRIRIVMRRGTGAEGATSPGALEVRVQSDDGAWGEWQPVSVGVPEDYVQTQDLFLGGVFRRRRYGFRYSTTEDVSLVSAHDDITDTGAP